MQDFIWKHRAIRETRENSQISRDTTRTPYILFRHRLLRSPGVPLPRFEQCTSLEPAGVRAYRQCRNASFAVVLRLSKVFHPAGDGEGETCASVHRETRNAAYVSYYFVSVRWKLSLNICADTLNHGRGRRVCRLSRS